MKIYHKLLLTISLSALLLSCSASSKAPQNDIEVLAMILEANPNNKLNWEFDLSDPKNPQMTKSEGVTFENIAGAERVTRLQIGNKNIVNLDAIAYLTELLHLECFYSSYSDAKYRLRSLDVSKNTKLASLYCNSNQLSSLDVSKNTKLTLLSCESNQLSSLDVSKNTELIMLYCLHNELKSLDVSENTELIHLSCDANQLSSLDVSKNTELTLLSCNSNKISLLNTNKNTELRRLSCDSNQLSSLDVSKNTELVELFCKNNQFVAKSVRIMKKTYETAFLSPAAGDTIYNPVN